MNVNYIYSVIGSLSITFLITAVGLRNTNSINMIIHSTMDGKAFIKSGYTKCWRTYGGTISVWQTLVMTKADQNKTLRHTALGCMKYQIQIPATAII